MSTDAPLRPSGLDVTVSRSLLFVPGHRSDRFDKAARSGADLVVCDLEDAVAAEDKAAARSEVVRWLGAGGTACVRVNSARSPWFEADLAALLTVPGLCAVMVPKSEDAQVLAEIARDLGPNVPLVALVESALGVHSAYDIARAAGVVRLAFGSIDFALDIEAAEDDRSLLYARSVITTASRAAGIVGPIDGVTTELNDVKAVQVDALAGYRLGFTGKLCVHPRQVAYVNEAFSPTADHVASAQYLLESSADGRAGQIDGRMVDKPVLDRARRVLERASMFSGGTELAARAPRGTPDRDPQGPQLAGPGTGQSEATT